MVYIVSHDACNCVIYLILIVDNTLDLAVQKSFGNHHFRSFRPFHSWICQKMGGCLSSPTPARGASKARSYSNPKSQNTSGGHVEDLSINDLNKGASAIKVLVLGNQISLG